jgi:dihydrofolate reductase
MHDDETSSRSRVLYAAAMSLDGFIAGPGGDMSWMTGRSHVAGPSSGDLMSEVGSLLVGRRTYGGDDPNKGTDSEGAFGGQWQGPVFVVSRSPAPEGATGVFVDDLRRAVELAKASAGGKYVNVLGANLAKSCLEAGLLDEVMVVVVPVLLGDGVRLFDHPGGRLVELEPREAGSADLWFRVVREDG